MSRDLEDENFYVVSGGKIPVKWTAPEVQIYRYVHARIQSHSSCSGSYGLDVQSLSV